MIGYCLIDPTILLMVTETPPNAKYYKHEGDLNIVADMFEEWKEWIHLNNKK